MGLQVCVDLRAQRPQGETGEGGRAQALEESPPPGLRGGPREGAVAVDGWGRSRSESGLSQEDRSSPWTGSARGTELRRLLSGP